MCKNPLEIRRPHRREARPDCPSLPPLPPQRCGHCAECIRDRVQDWVGRCMGEALYATATYSVTLTYGPDALTNTDPENALALKYSDIQNLNKKLRNLGYTFKMLCAGEYGGKTGRAHWHALYFIQKPTQEALAKEHRRVTEKNARIEKKNKRLARLNEPLEPYVKARNLEDFELPITRFYHWDAWPHGHSCIRKGSGPAVGYVVKYLDKGSDPDKEKVPLRMSKVPPIGEQLFKDLAQQYVSQGLAPQNGIYTVPNSFIYSKEGRETLWNYRMFGAAKRIFVKAFIEGWENKYPGRELPASHWLNKAVHDVEQHEKRRLLLSPPVPDIAPLPPEAVAGMSHRERKEAEAVAERQARAAVLLEGIHETIAVKQAAAAERKKLSEEWQAKAKAERAALRLDVEEAVTIEGIAELPLLAETSYYVDQQLEELYRVAGDYPDILELRLAELAAKRAAMKAERDALLKQRRRDHWAALNVPFSEETSPQMVAVEREGLMKNSMFARQLDPPVAAPRRVGGAGSLASRVQDAVVLDPSKRFVGGPLRLATKREERAAERRAAEARAASPRNRLRSG